MKKTILLSATLTLLSLTTFGQGFYIVRLANDHIDIQGKNFYINSVTDSRADKSNIGIIQKAPFNTKSPAKLEYELAQRLLDHLHLSFPKTNGLIPVDIEIKQFKISEKTVEDSETGFFELSIHYYYKNNLIFKDKQNIEFNNKIDATPFHEMNIRTGLRKSFIAFWKSGALLNRENNHIETTSETTKDTTPKSPEKKATNYYYHPSKSTVKATKPTTTQTSSQSLTEDKNRDVIAIGYQVGGLTLIGIDYEFRVHDYIGIHIGGGYRGYTAGLKAHFGRKKNSSFINVSFKDGGYGLIQTFAVEYGGRIPLNKTNDFGLYGQVGLANILSIDSEFEEILFEGQGAIPIILSLGVGVSW